MNWPRAAVVAGAAVAVVTFFLLAPLQCETHYMRFVPGGWDTESVWTGCRGVAAFHYQESKELIGPRQPEGGTAPRPSLLQPQAVVTAAVIGGLVALFVWLLGERPRGARSLRWAMTPVLLAVSFVSAIDPGGLVIYATPVLIPVLWWMALQSGVIARAMWALVGGFLSVEAVALFAYGSSNALVAPLLLAVGVAVVTMIMAAPRWRSTTGPQFPNF